MSLLLIMPLMLCACIDDELTVDSADDESETVSISCSIANFTVNSYSATRATSEEDMEAYDEPWSESPWLETTLNRLDLFVFKYTKDESSSDSIYSLAYHFYNPSPSADSEWRLTYTNTANNSTVNYSYHIIDDTDSLYLIANYDFNVIDKNNAQNISNDTIVSLTKLKSLLVYYNTDNGETPYGPRSNFFYSAHLRGDDYSLSGKKHIYNFNLQRFMAKACIRIYYKALDSTSYTQLTKFSSKDIELKAMRYSKAGPVVDDGVYPISYSAKASGTKSASSDTLLYSYTYTDIIGVDSMTTALDSIYYYDSSSGYCAVYYFYPNDWLDMNLVPSIREEQPIRSSRRTYISMDIIFNNRDYVYEIPLNYLLPTNNDDTAYSYPEYVSDNSYKDLYRIYANRIYNVNVFIAEVDARLIVSVADDEVIEALDDGGTIEVDEGDLTPLSYVYVTDSDEGIISDLDSEDTLSLDHESESEVVDTTTE